MKWRHAGPDDQRALNRFLEPREYRSISLTSRLVRKRGFALPSASSDALLLGFAAPQAGQGQEEPQAAVLRTGNGLLLPLFHEDLEPAPLNLEELRLLLEQGRKIYCILGMRSDVDLCAALQPHTLHATRHYLLMRRELSTPLPEPPSIPGLQVRRVTRRNAARVFPLEEAYQREEVLVHPEQFSPTAHYLHFSRSLRHNQIYMAELDGEPVGKAGTNAIGAGYCQIGGVFTKPELRGRGISRILMNTLLSWIYRRGQSAALFVDSANAPAIRLYERLGFNVEGEYEIVYTKLD